jgi:UDPglucose 6-dehydrogenase
MAKAGYQVSAFDPDPEVRKNLSLGQPPLFEPGLKELLREGLDSERIRVPEDISSALEDTSLVWVAFDTPVDEDDHADVDFVIAQVTDAMKASRSPKHFLLSSQLPVGSSGRLEKIAQGLGLKFEHQFSVLPENLRLGQALQVFTKPDRVVIGVRSSTEQEFLRDFFAPFDWNILWMSNESAEMAKHAINAFLATSVTFINELARLCGPLGANPFEVEQALKSDVRIGPKAYLKPGGPFRGGTLARDIQFLKDLGHEFGEKMNLVEGVGVSNAAHSSWPLDRLNKLGIPAGSRVALLGLTYKPGTDTLRRSYGLELAEALHGLGFKVMAFDPMLVNAKPSSSEHYHLTSTLEEALQGTEAALLCTPHEEFKKIDPAILTRTMKTARVIDPQGHLSASLKSSGSIRYFTLGV